MKTLVVTLLFGLAVLGIWGCPRNKYIPDPIPPEPQVQVLEETPGYLGRVPPAGLRVFFRRMLAYEKSVSFIQTT